MNHTQRWRQTATEVFGIDLRTLALFRAALGAFIVFYCCNRFPDIGAFFTDWGVLPRSYAVQADAWSRYSLYLINGEYWFAALLLSITVLAGVALLFGYRTRAATIALFVLMCSLVTRNPAILVGGDEVLVCLLFWSLFLPLGARWSVDAALSTNPPPQDSLHCSWASAALLIQVLSVYFFSAWLKNGADWWPDGLAVYYTMEFERYASPLGRELAQFPRLMSGLTYFVYFLEWFGPVLALSPWLRQPLRFLVMACLMAMHAGFILFMEIGYFPFISLVSLTTLLGGWWWDWAARRADHGRHLKIYYDQDCGFCLKSCVLFRHFLVLPRTEILPAQGSTRASALMQAQYSWVVIDGEDVAHTKWNAWVALLRHSLLFGWTWRLAALRLWERPGNIVYDWVGRHRGAFGTLTAWLLPERSVKFETGRGAQRIAAVFLVLVFLWNLSTVGAIPLAYQIPVSPVFRLLRLDQLWNMFAPQPSHRDGWAVYPGKLEDGTEVDVLRPGEPLSWERPRYLSQVYSNIAWRTYRWRIVDKPFTGHLLYYGKYLCREWNWDAPPGKRLVTFDMNYVLEWTSPPGQAHRVERWVVWRHDCRPQETEKEKQERQREKRDPMERERSRPV